MCPAGLIWRWRLRRPIGSFGTNIVNEPCATCGQSEANLADPTRTRPTRLYPAGGCQPDGIILLLIGGKRGSGVKSLGEAVVDRLENHLFATEAVYDDSFRITVNTYSH